ncbi:MAG: PAS domain-containing sensor histidine kinase [Rickettsiales bacterium]|nr:PAS domain-containing sensor histidine kinase [Rickettsiales bacterium]
MLFIDFWNNYLKHLSDTQTELPSSPSEPILTPTAPIFEEKTDEKAQIDQLISILEAAERYQTTLSSKEKYDYLSQYGTQILCLLSAEKGCSYVSKNFETITGHDMAMAAGDSVYSIIHSDYHQRLRELLASKTIGDKPQSLRCKLQHGDGNWQWYLFLVHNNHNDSDEKVCIIENINESMVTQNTLQKAKLEAELALRARSEFLANMSHDLRTPLNAVIGFSQIIDSQMFGKIGNPQYLEYIKHIQESGYDLLSKIEDLLEIANIDAGRVGLDKSEAYLGDIIQHATHSQAHHAASAGISIQYQIPQDDPLLYVDRLKLQHIIGHLIANAIRHSSKGDMISIEAAISQDEELIVRIRDNGSGIPRGKLNLILGALKEESCWSAATNNQGIGLGLALTKEFIALHGGNVKIISKVDVGTTVYFTLPKHCLRIETPEHPRFAHLVAS